MLTEGARNAFFAADIFDYNSTPGDWQYQFWGDPMTFAAARWMVLIAVASATAGLWWGNWMARVRR